MHSRISRQRVPQHGAFALSLAALTLFLGATLSDSAVGGETGAIPYRTISDIFDHFAGLKDKDKLVLTVRVVPAKKSVSTVPIELLIKSRSGPITLRLGADGELIDFPLKAELEAENPPVASNQPKGTLSLQAVLGIKYSGKLTENLNWYLEGVRQAKAGAKAQAGLLSFGAPKLKTLVFHLSQENGGSVTLKTPDGSKPFMADDQAAVRLDLRALEELKNAQLIFSSAPRTATIE